nr:hypothetical protein [Spirosoma fluviale]
MDQGRESLAGHFVGAVPVEPGPAGGHVAQPSVRGQAHQGLPGGAHHPAQIVSELDFFGHVVANTEQFGGLTQGRGLGDKFPLGMAESPLGEGFAEPHLADLAGLVEAPGNRFDTGPVIIGVDGIQSQGAQQLPRLAFEYLAEVLIHESVLTRQIRFHYVYRLVRQNPLEYTVLLRGQQSWSDRVGNQSLRADESSGCPLPVAHDPGAVGDQHHALIPVEVAQGHLRCLVGGIEFVRDRLGCRSAIVGMNQFAPVGPLIGSVAQQGVALGIEPAVVGVFQIPVPCAFQGIALDEIEEGFTGPLSLVKFLL